MEDMATAQPAGEEGGLWGPCHLGLEPFPSLALFICKNGNNKLLAYGCAD